jgi:hypothetical protein
MLIDLMVLVAAAFCGGGVALIARHLSRWRLPKWIVPVAAGAAMLTATVAREYSWYGEQLAALGDQVTVVSAPAERVFYRPWTFVVPLTSRFIAVDGKQEVQSETVPGLKVAMVVVEQRWARKQAFQVAVDCTAGRRAELLEGAEIAPDGSLSGTTWLDVGLADPLVAAACIGG